MGAPSIDLYTWATPNGWKASCTLEELGIPYALHPVDITKGQQWVPEYLTLLVIVAIIPLMESNPTVLDVEEAVVGDGDAVGITCNISKNLIWSVQKCLGVYHPLADAQGSASACLS